MVVLKRAIEIAVVIVQEHQQQKKVLLKIFEEKAVRHRPNLKAVSLSRRQMPHVTSINEAIATRLVKILMEEISFLGLIKHQ